jgi:hypothetical protein
MMFWQKKKPEPKPYRLDWNKVKTIEDIKTVILLEVFLRNGVSFGVKVCSGRTEKDLEKAIERLLIDD